MYSYNIIQRNKLLQNNATEARETNRGAMFPLIILVNNRSKMCCVCIIYFSFLSNLAIIILFSSYN